MGADMSLPQPAKVIKIEKSLPVLIGSDYQHVMAKATIEQTSAVLSPTTRQELQPAQVEIIIRATGPTAQILGDFVAAMEVVALSFSGVPVRPASQKES